MSIAEMDCSRDGNLDFARKLHEAGVFADYHVWGACNHNTCDPNTPLGKEVSLEDHRALRYALAYNFDRSWANEK